MYRLLLSSIIILLFSSAVMANNGLIDVASNHDVKTTADRLEMALTKKGMTVFVRINHAAGAHKIGKALRPTELVIFGNPKVGTPLMQCRHSVAIDLPNKALIWQDEAGQVWLTYNNPAYLVKRHGITGCEEVIKKTDGALRNFAKAATSE